MPFKDRGRTRKLVLAGAVAFTLAGTGAALAWPADGPSPSPSSTAQTSTGPSPAPSGRSDSPPGHQDKQHRQDKREKQDKQHRQDQEHRSGNARGGRLQHSESVVKDADGGFRTVLVQRGTVEAVSSTSVTVRSEDGYSQTYAVDTDTKINGRGAAFGHRPQAADDDDRQAGPRTGTIADIAVGDAVRIFGVKEGDRVAATRIGPGTGNLPGKGR